MTSVPPLRAFWHVGTLTYTTASLIPLFCLLLLGDIAWSLKERAVPEVFKAILKDFTVGPILWNVLVGGLPALALLLLGPMVGAASDRHRSRLGRRIPFLLATTPLIFIGIAGMALSLPLVRFLGEESAWGRPAGMIVLALSWVIFEVATVIGNAMFTALIKDTVPDRLMGRFYGFFRACSLLVGIVFFQFFYGNEILDVSTPLLLGIGAFYVGGFLLLCWRVQEGFYPDPGTRHGPRGPYGIVIGSLDHPFYITLFLTFGLATFAFVPVNNNAFLAKDAHHVELQSYGQALASTYVISLVLAVPLGWLTDIFHPLRMGFITLIFYAVTMAIGWAVVRGETSFVTVFIIHGVISGAFFTTTASLLARLLPGTSFSQRAGAKAAIAGIMTVIGTAGLGVLLKVIANDLDVIFLVGALLATGAAVGWMALFGQYRCLGGYHGYVAPEPAPVCEMAPSAARPHC